MPILGTIASGISGHLTPPWSPEGAYDSLNSITLSTSAASVTFQGIPTGYKHLQIRGIVRGDGGNTDNGFYLRLNSDSGTNYTRHRILGDGTSATASANTSLNNASQVGMPAGGASGGIFGTLVIDILDYANTNKYTTVRTLGGHDRNGAGFISPLSNLWLNTDTVTSILIAFDGPNMVQHSHFALYGVK
jgi:hypothetical protein